MTSVLLGVHGQPDAHTQQAMMTLAATLSDEEYLYLDHMRWDAVDVSTVTEDLVIAKALQSLAASSSHSAAATGRAGTIRPFSDPINEDLYAFAKAAMTDCYGEAVCNDPGCVAAVLQAHIDVYGPIGQAATDAGHLDSGTWQCTLTFGTSQTTDQCTYEGWCEHPQLNFGQPPGTPDWQCNDPNFVPGPSPTRCMLYADGGLSTNDGGPGDGGGSANTCFVGEGVQASPALWQQICVALSAQAGGPARLNPLDCLDANPTYGIGAPVLADGSDPTQVCIQVHNADAMLANGTISGCDHDIPGDDTTCWCCP